MLHYLWHLLLIDYQSYVLNNLVYFYVFYRNNVWFAMSLYPLFALILTARARDNR